ncbi:MAG: class II glutamine amidotransferase [Alphaproteobacteria bacterium]|nr:class II glutamine amidotransferase [Alphaproteobacteria bacterium]
MCRFFVYKGHDMLMSDLLMQPERSLIRQSFKAREWEEPLNGDGFGVGWYAPEIDPTPCVYTSVSPAWSNRNLQRLSEKIRSGCFFAHVRAATPGLPVNDLNCHPFQYGRLLWMHNGAVSGFSRLRREIRESLTDRTYNMIQGTTDTEHAFAVFLDLLLRHGGDFTADDMAEALAETLLRLKSWRANGGIGVASHYNFAVTDGETVIATRYVDDSADRPHSLYMAQGEKFQHGESGYRMIGAGGGTGAPGALIVASEPLTDEAGDWDEVPPNHMIVARSGKPVELRALS